MMLRIAAILSTGAATWALWFGYDSLGVLRGTPFWDFRYVAFMAAAFLWLSALEWALGRIGGKARGK